MYGIEFYETEDGKCPIWDFLEALRLKAPTNKDARIQHKQASLYIELLQQNGTHMNAWAEDLKIIWRQLVSE